MANRLETVAEFRAHYGPRYRWMLLLALMVGVIATVMSSTIVNVAIPALSAEFGLGQDRAQWVSSGFMAASTTTMLLTPWMLSRYGYRHTYLACNLLLLVGCLLGGFAGSFSLVLLARVIEGLASGVVGPLPAIVIMRAFEPHEQGRASGLFGMGVLVAPALGPSLGGVLVDLFGWRATFFMFLPLCALSLLLGWRLVPNQAPGGVPANAQAGVDWQGLLLATLGTVLFLNGLVMLKSAAAHDTLLVMAAAVLALAAFVLWQHRQGRRPRPNREPLMNLALYRHLPFAMGSLVGLCYGVSLFGSTYLLPLYLQAGMGLSPSYVGALMLPAGLILAGIVAFAGGMADRQPVHRLVSAGMGLLALSFIAMVASDQRSPLLLVVLITIVGRVGLGFVLPSLNLGAMRGLDRRLMSQGASTINFIRMLGGATGISLCGVFLEWRLSAHHTGLALGTPEQVTARIAAFHETFVLLGAICLLSLFAAWRMRHAPGAPGPVRAQK
ncbi:MAG: hypothetical protein RJA36_2773 [Pseudomonadota bacterium]|jgi:EmrB/QacA subfamily drug resistance transporter